MLQISNSLLCPICSNKYDVNGKPCRGSCSHTICLSCKEKWKIVECPICGRVDSFKETQINYTALEQLEQSKDLDWTDIDILVVDNQDITKGPCHECNNHTDKLRLCIECAEKDGLIRKIGDDFLLVAVKDDESPKFLKLKGLSMCADCALEGAHSGHKIKLLAEAIRANLNLKTSQKPGIEVIKNQLQQLNMEFDQKEFWKKRKCKSYTLNHYVPRRSLYARREIQKVRRMWQRERKAAIETEKFEERRNLLTLEWSNWGLLIASPTEKTTSEQVEAIRSQTNFTARHLTPRDVSRIDDLIMKRMIEIGSLEAFEAATDRASKSFLARMWQKEEAVANYWWAFARLKIWGEDKESKMFRKCTYTYARKAVRKAEAEIAFNKADQDATLYMLMSMTMDCIGYKLLILKSFFELVDDDDNDYETDE